jgi:ankyrin repeat protein
MESKESLLIKLISANELEISLIYNLITQHKFKFNKKLIKALVSKGHNIDTNNQNNQTPLHQAIYLNNIELVRLLINHGASPFIKNKEGLTAIEFAFDLHRMEIILTLINNDFLNSDPIIDAIFDNSLSRLKQLLGDNKKKINQELSSAFYTPLHYASYNGKLQIAKYLIENGADINVQTLDLYTPLHFAIKYGHVNLAKYLIEQGADINLQTYKKEAAIHISIAKGLYSLSKLLIDKGADLTMSAEHGTPLHYAEMYGDLKIAKHLIKNGSDINAFDDNKDTVLHNAIYKEYKLEFVRLFLKYGADINLKNKYGDMAIDIAIKQGNTEGLKLLNHYLKIKPGLELNLSKSTIIINLNDIEGNGFEKTSLSSELKFSPSKDDKGDTSLHLAAQEGNINKVQILLDQGVSINIADKNGNTPLHIAACNNDIEIAEVLITKGANINIRNHEGSTPLHLTAGIRNDDAEMVLLLLKYGADYTIIDNEGNTIFHKAVIYKSYNVIDILIRQKLDINIHNLSASTPLHSSTAFFDLKVYKLLIENGANINAQNYLGNTALHDFLLNEYSRTRYPALFLLLLKDGINLNLTNREGKTALMIAEEKGDKRIINILRRTLFNPNHYKPQLLINAIKNDNYELTKELVFSDPSLINYWYYGNGNAITKKLHLAALDGNILDNSEDIYNIKEINYPDGSINYEIETLFNDIYLPIHIAAKDGRKDIIKLLIENGANINAESYYRNKTALSEAICYGKKEIVETLLTNGADVNVKGKNGNMAIHSLPYSIIVASIDDITSILKLLLSYGANINSQDNFGRTVLHTHIPICSEQVIKLLLENGADPNICDNKNENAAHLLEFRENEEKVNIAKLLFKHGCDTNVFNKKGQTPIQKALSKGFTKIAMALQGKHINPN